MTAERRSALINRCSSFPFPKKCCCPENSSSDTGRIRRARGCAFRRFSASDRSNRDIWLWNADCRLKRKRRRNRSPFAFFRLHWSILWPAEQLGDGPVPKSGVHFSQKSEFCGMIVRYPQTTPQFPPIMQTRKQQYYKRLRMELDLRGWSGPQLRLPRCYQLIPWDPRLVKEHATVKFHSFRDEVDVHVFPCLGDYAGCHKLMDSIRSKKGFLPEATWLIKFLGDGLDSLPQYCGTIQAILTHRGRASIQNVGVTPSHREKGLGKALLLASMIGLRRLKIRRARLEVTAQNVPAVQLYRHFGFRTVRTLYKPVAVACNQSTG